MTSIIWLGLALILGTVAVDVEARREMGKAILSIVGVIAAPAIVLICAPGFATKDEGQYALAVEMLRWTFPYLLFVSLTALAGGVLNSYQQFALPAFSFSFSSSD